MSLMWMPAQTTLPPLRTRRSASGTSAPTGAKMIAASISLRRRLADVAGPRGPEIGAKSWPASSPGRVNANTSSPASAAAGRRCGRRRRSRRGRAARASPAGGARDIRSAPRTAAAPPRVGVPAGSARQKRASPRLLAKPPSRSKPVKRARSQSSRAGPAVAALAAGAAEPGHADPVAAPKRSTPAPTAINRADDLVPGHERHCGRELAVGDVEVGAADPAGLDVQEHLPGARPRGRQLRLLERSAGSRQDHRAHRRGLYGRGGRADASAGPDGDSPRQPALTLLAGAARAPAGRPAGRRGRLLELVRAQEGVRHPGGRALVDRDRLVHAIMAFSVSSRLTRFSVAQLRVLFTSFRDTIGATCWKPKMFLGP